VWAFATAGVRAEALFAAVAEAAVASGLRDFIPQALAKTVWAFATVGARAEALFAAVAEVVVGSRLRDLTPQAMATIVWAFIAADVHHAELPVVCKHDISRSLCTSPAEWLPDSLTQLHQWQTWASLLGADEQLLESSALQRCRDAMVASRTTSSLLQRDVGQKLSKLETGWEEEFLEPTTGYALDLALPAQRRAVEVDGPSHFLLLDRRGERAPNGSTWLKRRLLASAGWRVVAVPYYEWDALVGAEAQQRYLCDALGTI